MLKLDLDRQSASQLPTGEKKTVLSLPNAESIDQTEAPVTLSSAVSSEAQPASVDSDVVGLSNAVVHGQLNNPELLSKLDSSFSHLSKSQYRNVVCLI